MKLTRDQRAQLLGGVYRPLVFERKPECEKGSRYVLTWSRATRRHDGRGRVYVVPREALLWIEVTTVTKTITGWTVRFIVHDHREPTRLVRAKPPRFDAELMQKDHTAPPDAAEIAAASEESNYTTDPTAAVDHLEAVEDAALKRFARQARTQAAQEGDLAQLRRERHELEQRLLRAREDAALRGVDISSPLRVIERQLAKIERRVYDGKAA